MDQGNPRGEVTAVTQLLGLGGAYHAGVEVLELPSIAQLRGPAVTIASEATSKLSDAGPETQLAKSFFG